MAVSFLMSPLPALRENPYYARFSLQGMTKVKPTNLESLLRSCLALGNDGCLLFDPDIKG